MKSKINYLIVGVLCAGVFFTGGYFISEAGNDDENSKLMSDNANQIGIILQLQLDKIKLQDSIDTKNQEYQWLSDITNQILNGDEPYPMCYDYEQKL